ncbi:MAG: hypothetical protein ACYCSJ_01510, partial [Acidimicrobiales bacterium]
QIRTAPCVECGTEVTKQSRPERGARAATWRCAACGIAFQAAWNSQVAAKSGPLYEEWRQKVLDAVLGRA